MFASSPYIFLTVFAMISCCYTGTVTVAKPYNMSVMALITFTGQEPRDGQVCRAAMQVAVDAANARNDFLSDYNVLPVYKDEGSNANYALKETVNFLRNNGNKGSFTAPVFVGPYYSTGCVRLVAALEYLNVVNFALGCSATAMSANRVMYPNTFHVRAQAEITMYSRYLFVKEVGKWDQVAILTGASSFRDYTSAVDLQKLLERNGVAVPWFNAVADMDANVVNALKESGLRVILMEIQTMETAIRFLCAAYLGGLTGNRYIFVPTTAVMFDPYGALPKLIPGCLREHIIEQLKYTFFVAKYMFAHKNYGPSSLGYDKAKLDELVPETIGNTTVRSQDFAMRETCHDAMMEVLMTLDGAGRKLAKLNLSLRDYTTNPAEIIEAVNASAVQLEPFTLRTGRQKWSRRLENDDEPQSIAYWYDDKKAFFNTHIVNHDPDRDYFDVKSYILEQLLPAPWKSANGRPPLSYPPAIISISEPLRELVIAILSLTSLISAIQLSAFCFVVIKTNLVEEKLVKLARFGVLFGCLLLNSGAICFILPNGTIAALCALRVACSGAGLSVLNGAVLIWMMQVRKSAQNSTPTGATRAQITNLAMATQSTSIRQPRRAIENPQFWAKSRSIPFSSNNNTSVSNRRALFAHRIVILTLFLAMLLTIIIWLGSDFPQPTMISITGGPVYHIVEDFYQDVKSVNCISQRFNVWLGLCCCVQAISCIYTLGIMLSNRHIGKLKPFAAVQANVATLLTAAIMINSILTTPSSQAIINSLAALAISLISFSLTVGREAYCLLQSKNINRVQESAFPL